MLLNNSLKEKMTKMTKMTKMNWTCVECPDGGNCKGPVTSVTLLPNDGWWPIPPAERNKPEAMFARCLYELACQHKSNETSFECNVDDGYRNHSRLCHRCKENYRRSSADQCAKCPEQAANWGLMILGFFMIMFGFAFIAGTAISSAGKQELSESVQKILLNYFQ